MTARSRAPWGLCALFWLSGCSLVIDEPKFPACTSHDDCNVLNVADGIAPDACKRWQCDGAWMPQGMELGPGRCVLRQRDDDSDGQISTLLCKGGTDCDDSDSTVLLSAKELCDGKDNDCDGVIDEPNGSEPVIKPVQVAVAETQMGVKWVGYGFDAASSEALALWVAQPGESPSARVARFADMSAVDDFPLRIPAVETQRRVSRDDTLPDKTTCRAWGSAITTPVCNPREVAVTFVGKSLLSAAVVQLGDDRGQIRVGYARDPRAPELIMRGPAARSNSYLGIDVDARGRAAGGSRTDGRLGATRLALAGLLSPDPGRAQALVAWLGDSPARSDCGGVEVNVEVVVAFLAHDRGEDVVTSVPTTTQVSGRTPDGAPLVVPRVLGTTTGGADTAAIAWQDRGYFVAYGSAAGVLALHFVPRPATPSPFVVCDPPCTPDDEPLVTSSLDDGGSWEIAPLTGAVNGVALALGRVEADSFEIGAAWREGCGMGTERIGFRRLVFSTQAGAVDLQREQDGDRFFLDAGAGAYGPPSIAYAATRFLRGDSSDSAGNVTRLGGWVVAWADAGSQRLLGRRISERDGRLLDQGPPIAFGVGHAELTARPWLYTHNRDRVGFLYFDSDRGAVVKGQFSCE